MSLNIYIYIFLENRHCSVLLLFHIIFSIYSYSTIIHSKFWELNYYKCDWGSLPCEGDIYTCLPSTKTQRSRCFKSLGPRASWAGLLHSQDKGPEQGHQEHLSTSKPRVSKLASQNIKGKLGGHTPPRPQSACLLSGDHYETKMLGCLETVIGPRVSPTIYSPSKFITN